MGRWTDEGWMDGCLDGVDVDQWMDVLMDG